LNDKECASSYGAQAEPALLIFRKFDNSGPLVYSGNWENEPIIDWITTSSVPTLIEFSDEYVDSIFGQKRAVIILFRNQDDNSSEF
jgi:hypothetical protein